MTQPLRTYLGLSSEDLAVVLLLMVPIIAYAIWREMRERKYRKTLRPEQLEEYFEELRNEQHPF